MEVYTAIYKLRLQGFENCLILSGIGYCSECGGFEQLVENIYVGRRREIILEKDGTVCRECNAEKTTVIEKRKSRLVEKRAATRSKKLRTRLVKNIALLGERETTNANGERSGNDIHRQ